MAHADPMSRIPYFMFQDREHGIDHEATEKLGYDVPKMVTFILIAPHGHRGDPMEFIADEFIERKKREANEGRYDSSWVSGFKEGLAAHREGKELPRSGTPLINWERTTKARRETLAKRFPTVEDLAAVPDSSLGDIGLDGRVLRDLAKGDIQAKKDLSPVVKELAEEKEKTRRLEEQMETIMKRLDAAEANTPKRKRETEAA
ncbi:hypothetical protein [Herminiimonas contaminans]|uniref:Uncharacterized protein n=1 Tax=Herminiimonas contaminans TaxID=1111140 RepID=A0ABS0ES41_9BURK|nr:hypothetical protein [Herminiimonas contaminans]MBF8177660.1 hypothetical protein [Herminiimonas contaminans]